MLYDMYMIFILTKSPHNGDGMMTSYYDVIMTLQLCQIASFSEPSDFCNY